MTPPGRLKNSTTPNSRAEISALTRPVLARAAADLAAAAVEGVADAIVAVAAVVDLAVVVAAEKAVVEVAAAVAAGSHHWLFRDGNRVIIRAAVTGDSIAVQAALQWSPSFAFLLDPISYFMERIVLPVRSTISNWFLTPAPEIHNTPCLIFTPSANPREGCPLEPKGSLKPR
jgi:hypothetical protein